MSLQTELAAHWDTQPRSFDAAMAALMPRLMRMADCLARGEADLLDDLVQAGRIQLWVLWDSPYQFPPNVTTCVWRTMLHARRWELERRHESLEAMEERDGGRNQEREEAEAA